MSLANTVQTIPEVAAALVALGPVWRRLSRLGLPQLVPWHRSEPSYTTDSLSLHLRIKDAAGERAELDTRHQVRFTTPDAGVIRDVVWGEGDPIKGYLVSGATLLGVRREGPKAVMFLALAHPPARGERAVVRTTRILRRALARHEEYLELQLERPTERIALKVTFPKGRPPKRAALVMTPPDEPARTLSAHVDSSGHAFVSWSRVKPKRWTTYRIAWFW